LAVFYYRPGGFIAGLIVFVGAYVLAHSLPALSCQSLRGLSELLLCMLGVLIHFTTLLTAPARTGTGLAKRDRRQSGAGQFRIDETVARIICTTTSV
jgi:hypothetical protein